MNLLTENGWNAQAVLDYYRAFDGVGGENHGMIIYKDGKKVYEEYCAPYTANMTQSMFSVTKCLVSLAVGFAVEEGKLSLQTKIFPYFKDYPHSEGKEWEEMTVEKLLLMESNKKFSFLQPMTQDHAALFMKAKFRKKKGFMYSNNDAHMLAALVEKVADQPLVDYLNERLFAPLGIEKPIWETNGRGVCVGGSGVYLTTEELSKITLCFADGGKWQGKQVIPSFWATEAVKKHTVPSSNYDADGFGYYLWQEKGTYRLEGLFGQFGVVIPSQNAVVTVTGCHLNDCEAAKVINTVLLPSLFSAPVNGADERLNRYLKERTAAIAPVKKARNKKKEALVKGAYYKRTFGVAELTQLMTKFPNGLLPNSIASSFAKRSKRSLDDMTVNFRAQDCVITWKEDGEKVTVHCGLNGAAGLSHVTLLGIPYTLWSYGYWEKNKFHAVIRPLNTVARKEFIFTFGKNGFFVRTAGFPEFRDFVAANAVASGVVPKKPVIAPVAIALLKAVMFPVTLPLYFKRVYNSGLFNE